MDKKRDVNSIDSILWLESLGFVRMTGVDAVVYTNTESEWMTQVWVLLEGRWDGYQMYDATDGLDFRNFFQWWEERSQEDSFDSNYRCA